MIVAYGENGITNMLLEAFDKNVRFLRVFLKNVKWADDKERKDFQIKGKVHCCVEQPGFGRNAKGGEPDGLIIYGRYLFWLETKIKTIRSISRKKMGTIENYMDIAKNIYLPLQRLPKEFKKGKTWNESVLSLIRKRNRNAWYFVLLTDGSLEEKKNKNRFNEMVMTIGKDKKVSKAHIGWAPMEVVRKIGEEYEPLKIALAVNYRE